MSKYVIQNTVSLDLLNQVGRVHVEAMLETDGRRKAASEGVVLPGDFAVNRSPVAWIDDWDEHGGSFVDPTHAAMVKGSSVVPTHEIITMAWRARPTDT